MELARTEFQHHSPDQIRAYLTATDAICSDFYDGSDTPTEVFVAVLNLVAAKTINVVQRAPAGIDLGHMAIPQQRR